MTMGCGKYQDELLDLVYDELDHAAAETLRTHAADCPTCAAAASQMLSTRRLSAQIVALEPPSGLDVSIIAEARATTAEATFAAEKAVSKKVAPDKPKFFEICRAWLLHPAFAGAAVIAVVVVVTFFITGKAKEPSSPSSSVESVLADRPIEVFAPPAPTKKAESSPEALAASEPPTESSVEPPALLSSGAKAPATQRRASRAAVKGKAAPMSPIIEDRLSEQRSIGASQSGAGRVASTPENKPSFSAPQEDAKRDVDVPAFAPPPSKGGAVQLNGDDLNRNFEAESAPQKERESPQLDEISAKDAYNAGMDAYRRGDCSTAIAELSTVTASPLSYPGKVPSAMHHIARCEKRGGKCAKAVGWYEDLIHQYPSYMDRPDALYESAACYKRLGRTDKARSILTELEAIPGWETRAREALQGL